MWYLFSLINLVLITLYNYDCCKKKEEITGLYINSCIILTIIAWCIGPLSIVILLLVKPLKWVDDNYTYKNFPNPFYEKELD